jgi:polysaccharide biosynthesis/export protein
VIKLNKKLACADILIAFGIFISSSISFAQQAATTSTQSSAAQGTGVGTAPLSVMSLSSPASKLSSTSETQQIKSEIQQLTSETQQATPETQQTTPETQEEETSATEITAHGETTSVIERYVNDYAVSRVSQFGYSLFARSAAAFAPSGSVPVGPDYVIGPGDEIRINVWGKIEGVWSPVVDINGNISLPKIGVVGVTGLTFKQLQDFLKKELSQYYSGFEMNVSMGALRTIRIYLVGNVRVPGAYTISSLSTLINGLFETRGPSRTGTMRDIQVKRNGKTILHFDMYDFLLSGDKTNDIRLMPEDIIYIPPIGDHVAIAGSVKNPAIYEMKGDMTALDLIKMAGGFNELVFNARLQVSRIVDNARTIVFESDVPHAGEIKLQGGDIVNTYTVLSGKEIVKIAGAVANAGAYGFSEGMTIKDLISLSGGLIYSAYDETAELTRVTVTNKGPVTEKITIKLKDAIEGKTESNITLQQNDYLFVRNVPDWRLYRAVTISGEVNFPGTYTIEKGELLSSLIQRAGGFTKDAYLNGTIFTRGSVRARQQETINEMVDRLERELAAQGTAEIASTLSEESAKVLSTELGQKRQFIEAMRGLKAKGRIVIKLASPDKLKGTPDDISLEEGDSIYIPEDPRMIYTIGSVYNQSAFIYDKQKDVSDYIQLSGNYTETADKGKVYLIKANGSAINPGGGGFLSRNNIASAKLQSGDSIIVPEKVEKSQWLMQVKDITQILYQIAVTAGVLIVAY